VPEVRSYCLKPDDGWGQCVHSADPCNRVAQAVTRRNGEIMRQAMAEMEEAVKAAASAQAPEDKAAKQVELLKAAYQHAVANMKELSELIQKANAEALGLLSRRFSEGMDEVKSLMDRFGSKPGS
jgi:phasin family protein